MGRRKKKQEQLPRTLRHLQDWSGKDVSVVQLSDKPVPSGRGPLERLKGLCLGPSVLSPNNFSALICHPNNDRVQWFCDANLFIAPTDDQVWRSLLSRRDRLVLAPPVHEELHQWLAEPIHNLLAHEAVSKRLTGDDSSPVRVFDPFGDGLPTAAIEYYVDLVGYRKFLHASAETMLQENLRRSPSAQEISNFCKDRWGIRSQMLARKGAVSKVPAYQYNDEALVVMAVVDAICSGRETVILTTDEDVFEQFYKTVWLLDTHYRGMLLAQRYLDDPLYFSPTRTEREPLSEAFDGEVLLLTKPSETLREILPRRWTLVPISCMLIKNGQLNQHTFAAETEMSNMLAVKMKTGGRSTDLFDDRNCHVCLAGWMNHVGNLAAIGRDRTISPTTRNCSLSLIDLNLVSYCREGFVPTLYVDPNTLWLPSRFREGPLD